MGLRQFIQEAHPVVRERHPTRHRHVAPADQAGGREGVVGGAARAGGDQGRAAAGAAKKGGIIQLIWLC
jgi:hypothetical protein